MQSRDQVEDIVVVPEASGQFLNQRQLEDYRDHRETGFDVIWLVCRDRDVRGGIQRRLEDAGDDMEDLVFLRVQDLDDELDSL